MSKKISDLQEYVMEDPVALLQKRVDQLEKAESELVKMIGLWMHQREFVQEAIIEIQKKQTAQEIEIRKIKKLLKKRANR